MIDLEGVTIKSTGIPIGDEQKARVAGFFMDSKRQKDTEIIASMKPAQLTVEETTRLKRDEEAAKDMLRQKMTRLGVSTDQVHLPQVNYIAPQYKEDRDRVGFTGGLSIVGVIIDRQRGDIYDAAAVTMHELSHVSTSKEARIFWRDQQGKPKIEKTSMAYGLGITGGSGQELGTGIENGLAICDEVDFINTYLAKTYPDDFQKRAEWADRLMKSHSYKNSINPLYLGRFQGRI